MRSDDKTVLVIESSPDVAEVLGDMLESVGCRPLICLGGREGIDMFRERADAVDMVLLDVFVQHFRYLHVAEQIWAIRPDVPIALDCDSVPVSLRSTVAGRDFSALLLKPFKRHAITALLSSVLGASAAI